MNAYPRQISPYTLSLFGRSFSSFRRFPSAASGFFWNGSLSPARDFKNKILKIKYNGFPSLFSRLRSEWTWKSVVHFTIKK
jgi:hypothetical protein